MPDEERKRPRPSAFQRGVEALKNAEDAFGNIQLKDPEAKFMAPILEKLKQFQDAVEKKDPTLIKDDTTPPPIAPVPPPAAANV